MVPHLILSKLPQRDRVHSLFLAEMEICGPHTISRDTMVGGLRSGMCFFIFNKDQNGVSLLSLLLLFSGGSVAPHRGLVRVDIWAVYLALHGKSRNCLNIFFGGEFEQNTWSLRVFCLHSVLLYWSLVRRSRTERRKFSLILSIFWGYFLLFYIWYLLDTKNTQ